MPKSTACLLEANVCAVIRGLRVRAGVSIEEWRVSGEGRGKEATKLHNSEVIIEDTRTIEVRPRAIAFPGESDPEPRQGSVVF